MDPLYEITFPAAAGMIEQERQTTTPPLDSYREPHGVAQRVRKETFAREFLESGGEQSVQMVLALLNERTNVRGYAENVLRLAMHRLSQLPDTFELGPMYACRFDDPRDSDIVREPNGDWCRDSICMRFRRHDGQAPSRAWSRDVDKPGYISFRDV